MRTAREWLGLPARHGQFLLLGGLAVGIALPGFAQAMRPMIVPLILIMLFFAAARVGPAGLRAGRHGLGTALVFCLVMQMAMPLLGIAVLEAGGWLGTAFGLGLVLILAGAPITGTPGLTLLVGAQPASALRQVIIGTALLPLTVLPVFWLVPVFPDPGAVIVAAGTLMLYIFLSGGSGILAHRVWPGLGTSDAARAGLDSGIAITMGLIVIGLMSAVGPALFDASGTFWLLLFGLGALNFTLQALSAFALRGRVARHDGAGMAVSAGNRNLVLFLGVLPPETIEPMLLLVGAFQVPMYLTPMVMRPLYRRLGMLG